MLDMSDLPDHWNSVPSTHMAPHNWSLLGYNALSWPQKVHYLISSLKYIHL